jgi:hypothetical protein
MIKFDLLYMVNMDGHPFFDIMDLFKSPIYIAISDNIGQFCSFIQYTISPLLLYIDPVIDYMAIKLSSMINYLYSLPFLNIVDSELYGSVTQRFLGLLLTHE